MILIKHRDHEEYHQQGEPFRLKKNVYFLSTKPNEKAGRWYYEMTHYSGNNGCAFGFYINSESYVNYYSQLDLDSPVIYLNGNSKTSQQNEDQRIDLPFKLTDNIEIYVKWIKNPFDGKVIFIYKPLKDEYHSISYHIGDYVNPPYHDVSVPNMVISGW